MCRRNAARRFDAYSALCLLFGLLALPAPSQTTSTEILGSVTDSSGAVVPGAKVTITRVSTGETRSAVTNPAGEYTFPLIEIGEYRIHAELSGFRAQTVSGLRVELQQKARVNFVLEVGQVSENVEVNASAVALQTDDAAVGQVIENKRVVNLPLNGRNVINLAVMAPGVQFGTRSGGADGQGGYPIPGQGISVIANGQREMHQSISLDGVDAMMPLYNMTSWSPSIDAIEEFKVQTGSYSAEYGQGAGAHIQISIKSGTNQFRGAAFEFLRNDKLDAENYFLNLVRPAGTARLPKDRLRRNQFGAFLAGPIIRNKTFWSFNYESRHEIKETVSTSWWPNQDFRNGNFSALLNPAVNPATGRSYRAPVVIYDPITGLPFANNIVPANRISSGAQKVISQYLPLPDFQQADILDFDVRRPLGRPITSNQFFGRVDHNFSTFDKVFGRIAIDRATLVTNRINPNFPDSTNSRAYNLATQWVHLFNQNVLNEFRFGINNSDDDIINPRTNTDFDVDSLGIGKFRVVGDNNRKFSPFETGVPAMGFTIGDSNGRLDRTNTYQFADNISFVRSRHNLKAGAQFIRVTMDRFAANTPRGSLTFSASETGYDFASLLLGYPNRVLTGEGQPEGMPVANRFGIYLTDDWKVSSRLTLNIGVRWDYYGNPRDTLGAWRTLNFSQTYATPAGGKIPTLFPTTIRDEAATQKLWDQALGFIVPRFGFAYRPGGKWVIRSGAGWYSNVQPLINYTPLNLQPPLSGSTQLDSVTDAAQRGSVVANGVTTAYQTRQFRPGIPIITLDDPFSGGQVRLQPKNLTTVPPNHKNSDVWQWSFDLQRELPGQMALTLGYVGSKNTHVANSLPNFNAAAPSPDSNFQTLRPYPKFFDPLTPQLGIQDLGAIRSFDTYGNGAYHGLQVKVEKRFARGFSYGLAYTFSKALGEGENSGNESGGIQDPSNRRGSRGRYAFDQTHSAVIHWVWEIPFGQTLKGVPGVLLKGWQTNGILTLRTGFPFTPLEPTAVSGATGLGSGDLNTGDVDGSRPDRLRNGAIENPTRALWYDPSAFQRTTCNIAGRSDLCHYGNSGKNILNAPGQRNIDFSLFKNFRITERFALQFRAEAFNAFNTPYFNAPNNLSFVSTNSIAPDGPRMGEIQSLRTDMRVLQFGLKLFF